MIIAVRCRARVALSGTHLGSEFIPPLDEGEIWIRRTCPRASRWRQSAEMARADARAHTAVARGELVSSQTGRNDSGTDPFGPNRNEILVTCSHTTPGHAARRRRTSVDELSQRLQRQYPGRRAELHPADHRHVDRERHRLLGGSRGGPQRPGPRDAAGSWLARRSRSSAACRAPRTRRSSRRPTRRSCASPSIGRRWRGTPHQCGRRPGRDRSGASAAAPITACSRATGASTSWRDSCPRRAPNPTTIGQLADSDARRGAVPAVAAGGHPRWSTGPRSSPDGRISGRSPSGPIFGARDQGRIRRGCPGPVGADSPAAARLSDHLGRHVRELRAGAPAPDTSSSRSRSASSLRSLFVTFGRRSTPCWCCSTCRSRWRAD